MRNQALVAMVAAAFLASSAAAAEWTETGWGVDLVVDGATGLPEIVFHVALEYGPGRGDSRVETTWEVFAVVGGVEMGLDGVSTASFFSGEVRSIYAASPRVRVEPGGTYGARVTVRDAVNGLSHERAFQFAVPPSVPLGIPLPGWDGSEAVDLAALPDEELEELAVLHALLKRCSRSAADLPVDRFLCGDAATSAYPLSILLLPTAALDLPASPIQWVLTFSVYVYLLADPAETAGLLAQLPAFEQEFVGDVYTGPGGPILGGGKTIFVHRALWPILEEGAAELARRSPPRD